jgi:hypothetical protein
MKKILIVTSIILGMLFNMSLGISAYATNNSMSEENEIVSLSGQTFEIIDKFSSSGKLISTSVRYLSQVDKKDSGLVTLDKELDAYMNMYLCEKANQLSNKNNVSLMAKSSDMNVTNTSSFSDYKRDDEKKIQVETYGTFYKGMYGISLALAVDDMYACGKYLGSGNAEKITVRSTYESGGVGVNVQVYPPEITMSFGSNQVVCEDSAMNVWMMSLYREPVIFTALLQGGFSISATDSTVVQIRNGNTVSSFPLTAPVQERYMDPIQSPVDWD